MGVRGFPRRFRFPWRTVLDVHREVDAELDFHLAMRREALEAEGLAPAAAERRALAEFGDVGATRRSLKTTGWRAERRRRRRLMFEEAWRDLRFAGRSLARRPGFTLVAVLALALGIGANAGMFGLINLVLLRPILVEEPERIVGLYGQSLERPDDYRGFSYPTFTDIRERNDVFEELAGFEITIAGLREGDTTRRLMAALVSSDYFRTLGVAPRVGREFTAAEEVPGSALGVTVISHGLAERLGGASTALGETLWINGRSVEVVGIMPRGFTGTAALFSPELWLPLGLYDVLEHMPAAGGRKRSLADREHVDLMAFGRLRDGVDLDAALPRLEALAAQLREDYPKAQDDQTLYVAPLPRLGISSDPDTGASVAAPLALMMAMSLAVLLIACLDLANMFLARGESRRTEIAVRVALGGGRFRLVRQQLTEGFLLSLGGAALGLLAATWTSRLLFASFESSLPIGMQLVLDARPDGRVFGATLGLAVLATLLFGLVPAWRLTGGDVFGSLKDRAGAPESSGGRRLTLRNGLVVAQVALSLVLLTASGLFLRGAIEAGRATPGFDLDRSVLLEIDPTLVGVEEARSRELANRILQRVEALPGIDSVGWTSLVPFGAVTSSTEVHAAEAGEGVEPPSATALRYTVTGGYFDSLGLPILRGRNFTEAESTQEGGTPVAVVDEPLAELLWPGEDPIGRWIERPSRPPAEPVPPLQVVGVVPGVLHSFTDDEPPAHLYTPLGQNFTTTLNLHARATEPLGERASEVMRALREEVRAIDASLPVLTLRTMQDHRDTSIFVWMVRAGARIFGVFAALALFLALVGVYGVKAFAVSRRTREIGLRMALGATRRDVLRQMMRESAGQTILGLGLGFLLAVGVGRLLASLLYRVPPGDPLTLGGSALVLGLATLAATWLPARRATRVEPASVLREE